MGSAPFFRESIIPPELILRNPFYRPEMIGQRAPHDIWVHIGGIDIVRVDADEFYVLEDNARTPSGVSYMLENREVTMRLPADLFRAAQRRAGRRLSRPVACLPALGRAAAQWRRGDDRYPDTGRVPFRLLRAFVPRRQARRGTGRGPGTCSLR